MKNFLVLLLLLLLQPSHAQAGNIARQEKTASPAIQTIRVEKVRPEKKSGKWVEGKPTLSSIQSYDTEGNLISSTVHKNDGELFVKYSAVYAADGTKLEEIYADDKGSIRLKTIYQYDAQKRLSGKLLFGPKGVPNGKATVVWNKGEAVTEVIYYDAKDSIKGRTFYKYFPAENKIERRLYNSERYTDGWITIYDNAGRIIETETYDMDSPRVVRHNYRYDNNGHRSEELVEVGNGVIKFLYAYEFDAHGRWIKQTISKVSQEAGNNTLEPVDITYRRITDYAETSVPRNSVAWSLKQQVLEEANESSLISKTTNRVEFNVDFLRGRSFSGQATVAILVNELGRVFLAVPYGNLVAALATPDEAKRLRKVLEDNARRWRWSPTVLGGQPTPVSGTIIFNFR